MDQLSMHKSYVLYHWTMTDELPQSWQAVDEVQVDKEPHGAQCWFSNEHGQVCEISFPKIISVELATSATTNGQL